MGRRPGRRAEDTRPTGARSLRAASGWAAVAAVAFLGRSPGPANAQSFQPSRPRTLVVGAPPGARAERVDSGRTGLARTPLPTSGLRVEWRTPAGTPLDHGPLVDARGVTYVVGTRGEVVAVARNGAEQWRAPTGGLDAGPAALLADDSVVFVDGSGEAIDVRDGGVRWRSRFGRAGLEGFEAAHRSPPLPLDDGGVVVATAREVAVLDSEGRERARTALADPIATPMLSALGRVVLVGRTGAVWTWRPGAPEAVAVASFGSPVAESAALADDHTLVAVVAGGTTFAALDLRSGSLTTRAVAPSGTWLGPPAMRGETATLTMLGATTESAVTLDASGREIGRELLATHAALLRSDAGARPLESGVESGPEPASGAWKEAPSRLLVDREGTLVFATLAGNVGTTSTAPAAPGAGAGAGAVGGGEAAVEILDDACPRAPGGLRDANAGADGAPSAVSGLAPLPPTSFVVTCRSGMIVAVGGALGGGGDAGGRANLE